MRLNFQVILALVVLFTISGAGVSIAKPAKGMRYKTIADELDSIMRTKNVDWLRQKYGQPKDVETKYPGYIVFRWKAPQEKTDCKMAFAFSNKSLAHIEGWSTSCPTEKGNPAYGETAASTPIPKAVVPDVIRQVAQQEAIAEANLTRKGTFADWLHTFIGKTEEEVYGSMNKLRSSEVLHNGKVIKTYDRMTRTEDFFETTTWTCQYSLSFIKGVVVGYDQGSCSARFFENGYNVPATTPPAKASAL